jgi:hypothetical protein
VCSLSESFAPATTGIQGCPRPFKAINGYPSLFKGFREKKLFFMEGGQPKTIPDMVGAVLREFKLF